MDQPDIDVSVREHIRRLVQEEHRLFERGNLSTEDNHRLAAIQVELDQYWDLLRQRRARREFGGDAAEAQLRDADTVHRYVG